MYFVTSFIVYEVIILCLRMYILERPFFSLLKKIDFTVIKNINMYTIFTFVCVTAILDINRASHWGLECQIHWGLLNTCIKMSCTQGWFRLMVFNATFNNISVILWWSVLTVEETGIPGANHRPVSSHWQTLPHNVVYSTPWHEWVRTHNYHMIMTTRTPQA